MPEVTNRLPRYGVAVAATASASLLALVLSPLSLRVPFVLFAAAVIISSLEGGLKPGLVATTLATAAFAVQFWLLPLAEIAHGSGEVIPLLVLFVVVGLVSSYLGEQCWRAVHAVEWVQSALACFDGDFLYSAAAGPARLTKPIVAHALTNGNPQEAALRLRERMPSNVDRELGQAVPRSIERLGRGECQAIVAAATMPISKNVARDIRAARRKKTALRQREERFRSLAACAPAGILQMDPACRCVYSNCSGQLMGGFSAEEGAGDGWARFLHPQDRVRVLPAWFAAMQAGKEFTCEFRFQTPEASPGEKEMVAPRERWVRLRSSPMVSDLGKLIGHVAVLHDIHDQKVAEEALHETRTLLSAVAQALQMQANRE